MVIRTTVKFSLSLFLRSAALAATFALGQPAALRAQAEPAAPAEPMIGGSPVRELARSRIETPAETHWVGEIFPFTHRVTVAHRVYGAVTTDFDWAPDDLIFEEWSAPVHTQEGSDDIVTQTTRGYTKTAGAIRLPNTVQNLTLITQMAGDRTPILDKYTVTTVAPLLRVRDLPAPAPSAFAGAVGDFNLESRVTSTDVAVGDSVTWTLELRGTGNWPEITRLPARVVSKDFTGVAPILKRQFAPNALFEGSLTEDVLLVPTKPGSYQLGPVRFVYFDPKDGKYQLITTETYTLNVSDRPGGAEAAAEHQATTKDGRTLIPAAPPLLPLDPLPASWLGARPLSPALLTNSILAALGLLVIFWLRLAVQRSELTDPLHPRRRAKANLGIILQALDRAGLPPEEIRRLVFDWQRNVADLAGITTAMPTAVKIARALEGDGYRAAGSSWAALWRDANRALYGERPLLPTDWLMRAKGALSEITVPRVPFSAVFLRHNLLPFAALLVLALLPLGARATPLEDYNKGDFAAAEKGWRQIAATTPLDSHTRYNLSLAAAQQNHWSEAVAHALAAFCLSPRDPSIRWQFALSLERAGIENPAFSGFANGGARYKIARTFSPSEWSLVGSAAALLTAIAAAALLSGFYQRRSATYRWTAGAFTLAALLTVTSAVVSLNCYGPLAERSTAIVSKNVLLCSVPTEIDTTQKTVPLPAGSLARVDRTFLGWSRLVFTNGQTGWVRTEWVTSLYD
jgi:hypothetical protein